MLKFTYKQIIRERVRAKCQRHPRYNPEKDGRSGIKGGCGTCYSLHDLHQARLRLDSAIHDFVRRATPWTPPSEAPQGQAKPNSHVAAVVRPGQHSGRCPNDAALTPA